MRMVSARSCETRACVRFPSWTAQIDGEWTLHTTTNDGTLLSTVQHSLGKRTRSNHILVILVPITNGRATIRGSPNPLFTCAGGLVVRAVKMAPGVRREHTVDHVSPVSRNVRVEREPRPVVKRVDEKCVCKARHAVHL